MTPVLQPRTDVERFEAFFDYLRTQGFATGIGERLRAHRVLQLAGQNPKPERMKNLLCPVFARDAEEQERFYAAVDLYFGEPQPARVPTWKEGVAPVAPPAILLYPRRGWWKLWAAASLLSLAVAALFYWDVPRRVQEVVFRQIETPPPPPPARPPGSVREIRETRLEDTRRDCQGVECVVRGFRPLEILSPLLAVLLYSGLLGTAAFRRRRIARRRRLKDPPLEWPIRTRVPPLAPINRAFHAAARLLARRQSGDQRVLDVPATIDATVRRAGFVDLRYRVEKRPPEYLFLIDRRSPRDHLASWFETLAREFEYQGIRITSWNFNRDPRLCTSPVTHETYPLSRLAELDGKTRLVLFTDGEGLLSRFGKGLAGWIGGRFFSTFETPAILTPAPAFQWGAREAILEARFRLFPAKMEAVALLAEHFEAPERRDQRLPVDSREYPIPPARYFQLPPPEEHWIRPPLAAILCQDVFRWLCACALHYELRWELTLRLAKVVDPSARLLEERSLLQLIRLPWFREGTIPAEWRARLIQCLDPSTQKAAREVIIRLIEDDRAPRGSLAFDFQTAAIAAQRYWIDPDSPKRRAELELAVANMPASELAQDPLLANQIESWRTAPQRPWNSPLSWAQRSFHIARWRVAAAALLIVLAALWLTRVKIAEKTEVTQTRYESIPQPPPAAPDSAPPATQERPAVEAAPSKLSQPKAQPKPFVPPPRISGVQSPISEAPPPQIDVALPVVSPLAGLPQQPAVPPHPSADIIAGTVRDVAGAVIPGATIKVEQQRYVYANEGFGVDFYPFGSYLTDQAGRYTTAHLPFRIEDSANHLWTYRITASARGFKSEQRVVSYDPTRAPVVDFVLSVGPVEEITSVEGNLRVEIKDYNGQTPEKIGRVAVRQGGTDIHTSTSTALLAWTVPAGKYEIEVDLPSGAQKKQTVQIRDDSSITTLVFHFFTDPKKVRGIVPPAWEDLPADLRAVLANSQPEGFSGHSGPALYTALSEPSNARKLATLLNVYAKMKSVRCADVSEGGCFVFRQLESVGQEAIQGRAPVNEDWFIKNPVFQRTFDTTRAPFGHKTVGSYATSDVRAALHLTLFAKGGFYLLDAHVDPSPPPLSFRQAYVQALSGVFQLTSNQINPYEIHQLLVAQGIIPLYKLIEGAPGSSRVDIQVTQASSAPQQQEIQSQKPTK